MSQRVRGAGLGPGPRAAAALNPDPQAFEVTCARLEVRPQDCLFIDDFAPNIVAAQEAGMHGYLFEDNARTIARIEAHLAGEPTVSP
ncbi:HAD-IA family hydrolase [Streptomyces sp. NPDC058301]|uniref:HAD-IA family hydrolase n=1 Tax=Streptomyces sp. NPDC058301 TaxID=3346436 RepID=UPI0036E6A885